MFYGRGAEDLSDIAWSSLVSRLLSESDETSPIVVRNGRLRCLTRNAYIDLAAPFAMENLFVVSRNLNKKAPLSTKLSIDIRGVYSPSGQKVADWIPAEFVSSLPSCAFVDNLDTVFGGITVTGPYFFSSLYTSILPIVKMIRSVPECVSIFYGGCIFVAFPSGIFVAFLPLQRSSTLSAWWDVHEEADSRRLPIHLPCLSPQALAAFLELSVRCHNFSWCLIASNTLSSWYAFLLQRGDDTLRLNFWSGFPSWVSPERFEFLFTALRTSESVFARALYFSKDMEKILQKARKASWSSALSALRNKPDDDISLVVQKADARWHLQDLNTYRLLHKNIDDEPVVLLGCTLPLLTKFFANSCLGWRMARVSRDNVNDGFIASISNGSFRTFILFPAREVYL